MSAEQRRNGPDQIDVEGVPFERVGVLVWGRPAYANGAGDAIVWECGLCGALVARVAFHASHHAHARTLRDRAAQQARRA